MQNVAMDELNGAGILRVTLETFRAQCEHASARVHTGNVRLWQPAAALAQKPSVAFPHDEHVARPVY